MLLWKTAIWTIFFSGFLLLITKIENLCSWCSNLMYNDTFSWIFFVMLVIWGLPEKNIKNKDFGSLTEIFMLLFWVLKIFKTYIIVTRWIIACLQFDVKQATVKHHTKFFRQSVTKIMRKTAILTILCFCPLHFILTMSRNNEQNLRQAMLGVGNIV